MKWSSFIIRGIVALVIGIAVLFLPRIAVEAVVILFGALLLIVSVQTLVLAVKVREGVPRPKAPIAMGILGLILGIIALVFPWITAAALTLFIAILMMWTGFIEIATAIFHPEFTLHRYILLLTGALAVILGGIFVFFPIIGALVLVVVYLGIFAVAYGILSIVTGLMVRKKAAA